MPPQSVASVSRRVLTSWPDDRSSRTLSDEALVQFGCSAARFNYFVIDYAESETTA